MAEGGYTPRRGAYPRERGGKLIDGRAVDTRCSNLRLGTRPNRLLKQPESTQGRRLRRRNDSPL
jgi:hypothetical protein